MCFCKGKMSTIFIKILSKNIKELFLYSCCFYFNQLFGYVLLLHICKSNSIGQKNQTMRCLFEFIKTQNMYYVIYKFYLLSVATIKK